MTLLRTCLRVYVSATLIGLAPFSAFAQAPESTEEASGDALPQVFATVNGSDILLKAYVQALEGNARATFYHGRPPEGEFDAYRHKIGQDLIEKTLLTQEAQRRGIEADAEWVDKRVERLTQQYGERPEWQERSEEIIADLRIKLADQSQIEALEEQIQDIAPPSEEQLEAYYRANPEQFTSPPRMRASMILLSVDAWATTEVWQTALDEAARIAGLLETGGDFAELAETYSQDSSAERGGDLGYLHEGMIGEAAELVIAELEPGQTTDPIQVLEGVAIFRLQDKVGASLNPLSKVRERAIELWLREERVQTRARLIEKLKSTAQIEIRDPVYLALTDKSTSEADSAGKDPAKSPGAE